MDSSLMTEKDRKISLRLIALNDLPSEMLLKIFGFLNFNDLVACFKVSKKFRFISMQVKIKELIIGEIAIEFKDKWPFTNKSLNHIDSVNYNIFLYYKTTFNLGHSLRNLFIVDDEKPFNTDLKYLNKFTNLIQLIIKCLLTRVLICSETIFLPNLKFLKILERNFFYTSAINKPCFKVPKLEKLYCDHLDWISNAEKTVHYLDTLCTDVKTLKVFVNLDYLKLNFIDGLDKEILSHFEHLKELHLTLHSDFYKEYRETQIYLLIIQENNKLRNEINYVLKQKLVKRRLNLKIYLDGVELRNQNMLKCRESSRNQLNFQIQNYKLLSDNLSAITQINYTEVEAVFKDLIPDDFFTKFNYIKTIESNSRINNQKQFEWFVKNSNFLDFLYLNNSKLDQSFFDNLSNNCKIVKLVINDDQDLKINFDFILKLKLYIFRTNQQSKQLFDLALQLFRNSEKFHQITFKVDKEFFKIRKSDFCGPKQFDVFIYSDKFSKTIILLEKIDYNQLVLYCNYFKDKSSIIMTRLRSKSLNCYRSVL